MTTPAKQSALIRKLMWHWPVQNANSSLFDRLFWFRSLWFYNEPNHQSENAEVAMSVGMSLEKIRGRWKVDMNDLACDIMNIAGHGSFAQHQRRKGSIQMVSFLRLKKSCRNVIHTQSYSIFIDKDGNLDGMEHALSSVKKGCKILVPIHDNNGLHSLWIPVKIREFRKLMNEIKQFCAK